MPDTASPPDLAAALRAAMAARDIDNAAELSRLMIDPVTGDLVSNRQGVAVMLNPSPDRPLKNFPETKTIRALANALRVPHAAIYLPAAVTIGLDLPRQSVFAAMLPAEVDRLSAGDLQALQLQAVQMCRARGLLPG
jgi:hypothetical protein